MTALHVETSGDGPSVVLAHGFTQTGRLWGSFGETLGLGRRLLRVDLPGHAGSSDVRVDLVAGGELLAAAGGDQPFDLVGYSLGARFALHAALRRPELVRRLVLIGGTAGIEDDEARHQRRARDDRLAEDLERSGDVAGFVRRWLASPIFSTLRSPDAGERERNGALGLASSLRLAGTGTQAPLWDRLGELPMPALVLAGADDVRFVVAGARMAAAMPHAVLSLVPGGGHAAHLQQPTLTAAIVERFLAGRLADRG